MNHSAKVAWLLNEESNSISFGPGPCYTHLVLTFELGSCSRVSMSNWTIGSPLIIFMKPFSCVFTILPFVTPTEFLACSCQQERERTRTMNTDERLSSSFHPSLNRLSELTTSANSHWIRIKPG